MANDTVITVVGNLTADPELRYTQNGVAVANFTIASTPRTFDKASNEWKDGEALFLDNAPSKRRKAKSERQSNSKSTRSAPRFDTQPQPSPAHRVRPQPLAATPSGLLLLAATTGQPRPLPLLAATPGAQARPNPLMTTLRSN